MEATATTTAPTTPAGTILVKVEGLELYLSTALTQENGVLKKALIPFTGPWVQNANIVRHNDNGVESITVTKQAADKGAMLIQQTLEQAPARLNPAVALFQEIQGRDLREYSDAELLALEGVIDQTLERGEAWVKSVEWARGRLARATPVAAPFIVQGF